MIFHAFCCDLEGKSESNLIEMETYAETGASDRKNVPCAIGAGRELIKECSQWWLPVLLFYGKIKFFYGLILSCTLLILRMIPLLYK